LNPYRFSGPQILARGIEAEDILPYGISNYFLWLNDIATYFTIIIRFGVYIQSFFNLKNFVKTRPVNNEFYPFNDMRALIFSKGTSLGELHPVVGM
jgi:hypothetical protein